MCCLQQHRLDWIEKSCQVKNSILSMNEILICNEMSIKELVNENSEWEELLKIFKKEILTFCEERGYV